MTSWTTDPAIVAGRNCRMMVGLQEKCPNKAVAALRRSYGNDSHRWWGYCRDHLEGHHVGYGIVPVPRALLT